MKLRPTSHSTIALTAVLVLALVPAVIRPASAAPAARVIDIVAGHDSRFKLPGRPRNTTLTLTAGEAVVLRFTSAEAKTHNRDGSVHGLTLLRSDRTPVPGWDFLLKPGVQEFTATAPQEPGDYQAVCSVMCSKNHDRMTLKVVVLPRGQ